MVDFYFLCFSLLLFYAVLRTQGLVHARPSGVSSSGLPARVRMVQDIGCAGLWISEAVMRGVWFSSGGGANCVIDRDGTFSCIIVSSLSRAPDTLDN